MLYSTDISSQIHVISNKYPIRRVDHLGHGLSVVIWVLLFKFTFVIYDVTMAMSIVVRVLLRYDQNEVHRMIGHLNLHQQTDGNQGVKI